MNSWFFRILESCRTNIPKFNHEPIWKFNQMIDREPISDLRGNGKYKIKRKEYLWKIFLKRTQLFLFTPWRDYSLEHNNIYKQQYIWLGSNYSMRTQNWQVFPVNFGSAYCRACKNHGVFFAVCEVSEPFYENVSTNKMSGLVENELLVLVVL